MDFESSVVLARVLRLGRCGISGLLTGYGVVERIDNENLQMMEYTDIYSNGDVSGETRWEYTLNHCKELRMYLIFPHIGARQGYNH